MARVLPIHEFVLNRDKKHAGAAEKNSMVVATAAAGDINVKKMNKRLTMDMSKFNKRIVRVLKQVDPELSITPEAADVMNGILSNMMLKLIHTSFKKRLRRQNKSILSRKDINEAVFEVFPPQMAKLACQAARKAQTTLLVTKLSVAMDQTMSFP